MKQVKLNEMIINHDKFYQKYQKTTKINHHKIGTLSNQYEA